MDLHFFFNIHLFTSNFYCIVRFYSVHRVAVFPARRTSCASRRSVRSWAWAWWGIDWTLPGVHWPVVSGRWWTRRCPTAVCRSTSGSCPRRCADGRRFSTSRTPSFSRPSTTSSTRCSTGSNSTTARSPTSPVSSQLISSEPNWTGQLTLFSCSALLWV